jgi:hypothetical protein
MQDKPVRRPPVQSQDGVSLQSGMFECFFGGLSRASDSIVGAIPRDKKISRKECET